MGVHLLDSNSTARPEAGRLRALAAEVVAAVTDGGSLNSVLPAAQARLNKAQDRALLQQLCYGVLRHLRLLESLLRKLLDRPLTNERLRALLLIGLYQLRDLRMPPHAAVSETVAACRHIRQLPAKRLVNAVLRRYQRECESLEKALPEAPAVRYSHPDWLVQQLRRDWPAQWQAILAGNQAQGPMSLRVNARMGSREAYRLTLREAGFSADASPCAPHALTLDSAVPVTRLPGFSEGRVSVQDVAAQLAVPLLELATGLRVLDACAAPGGKCAHMLEAVDIELLALDCDGARLMRVRENLERLQLKADYCVADATDPDRWWDGRRFDRILLDAPCSGTGVIRRHPDIKWLRRESDIPAMALQQRRMLDALWPLLAPGGLLLYATCSLLHAECEAVITGFMQEHPDADPAPINDGWGESCGSGRRIACGENGMDGFYYARLRKAGEVADPHPQA